MNGGATPTEVKTDTEQEAILFLGSSLFSPILGSQSMGFPRQEHWSRLPFPFLGDLPHPGIELTSQMSLALTGGFFTTSATWGSLGNPFVVGVSETGLYGVMEGLI